MLIAFEGIDGAGTTTQSRRLYERLIRDGHSAMLTREPSDGPVGAMIRQAIARRVVGADGAVLADESIALLFAADRMDHARSVWGPRVAAGDLAITDRYVHSSLAYQSVGCPLDWVAEINRFAPDPSLVIFLDAPVDTCLQRVHLRGGVRDIYERRDVLVNVAAAYEDAFARRPCVMERLDATASVDEVHDAVWLRVERALRERS